MTSAGALERPHVEFFVMSTDIKVEPASSSVIGSLPIRATQLCAPVTAASGHGWYVYPPLDFALLWDGHTTSYSPLHENEPTTWTSLAGFYDGLLPQSEQITAAAPERFRSQWNTMHEKWAGRIPFCSADPRAPNHVEIVTGVAARTSPGWALLVRGVANWPGGVDHVNLEGVIETDWYHAFLPTVIRLLRQNSVVRFHRRFPYAMLQLVPKVAYDRSTATAASVATSLSDFPDDIWEAMIAKRLNRIRQSGDYLREQRKQGRGQ